ncbi:MAG: hypothetical protein FD164_570 [Nitrospirae bacterium]|nr:MAG: hypothetical protein FD164_570 [Nitrospirota bacterium]
MVQVTKPPKLICLASDQDLSGKSVHGGFPDKVSLLSADNHGVSKEAVFFMIISQSALNLTSEHRFSSTVSVREELRMWVDAPARSVRPEVQAPMPFSVDVVTVSHEASERLSEHETLEPRMLLLKSLLEALTGKKIKLVDMSSVGEKPGDIKSFESLPQDAHTNGQANRREGWGLSYTRDEMHAESEQVTVRAQGMVTTEDGRTIQFEVSFSASREFVSREQVSLRMGDAQRIDPLVVNLDGSPVVLSNLRFSFDLNADGQKEEIHFAGRGSGFLALDRNNDGIINDGRELFGPVTGSGFGELSAFDDDGNGWIDSRDAVFSNLMVWTKDAQGNDILKGLAESGIGAIALTRIAANFTFKNQRNEAQGVMREAGVYLRENGSAGMLQQIDMIV